MSTREMPWILIAEDDLEDRDMLMEALRRSGLKANLQWVPDGAAVDDYLYAKGRYSAAPPLPSLILMDMNMPRVGGLEATAKIKADPHLRQIPVVVFTTSSSPQHVQRAYWAGANSYVTKPPEFSELLKFAAVLTQYWTETATLPVIGQQHDYERRTV